MKRRVVRRPLFFTTGVRVNPVIWQRIPNTYYAVTHNSLGLCCIWVKADAYTYIHTWSWCIGKFGNTLHSLVRRMSKMKALKQKGDLFLFVLLMIHSAGLWPSFLPALLLSFPHNPESAASVFLFFYFPPWSAVYVWVTVQYFSAAHLWRTVLTDSPLWQTFFRLTAVILRTFVLSLSGFFSVPLGAFFVCWNPCCLHDWLPVVSRRAERHWMHHAALMNHMKSYSHSLYNGWAGWITRENVKAAVVN